MPHSSGISLAKAAMSMVLSVLTLPASAYFRPQSVQSQLQLDSRWANVTAGSQCEIENTGYVGYGESGEFVYVVSR